MELKYLLLFSLMALPLAWGRYEYARTWKGKEKSLRKSDLIWPLIINSAALYILAFHLIFFVQELFSWLAQKWPWLNARLYRNNSTEIAEQSEQLAKDFSATAIFVTAVICLFIARHIKLSIHWMQFFLLWIAFQGLVQSLPRFISSAISHGTNNGQTHYPGITDSIGLLIGIAEIILVLLTVTAYSQYLLQLTSSNKRTAHVMI